LIHDCQYADDEYPDHVGWGHSGLSDTLTFASRVDARRVLLFHHDPLHSDEFLDGFGATARRAWQDLGRDATQLELGMEGAELSVGPPVPAVHA
jgi:ribonuclease BN (tRNA processing enzyme)